MGRAVLICCFLSSVCLIGCCKDKAADPSSLSDDRALSAFALKVQRQLEAATDPTAVGTNDQNAESLTRAVATLRQLKATHEKNIASGSDANPDLIRERIALIRVDRQLGLVERLLQRYEQNAPAVASGQ